jgi:hypothetical protein
MHADTFADGLTLLARGDDSAAAEAAGVLLAEVILLHRAYLLAQRKERW